MRSTIFGTVALAAGALTLTQLAPANADSIGVSDPQDLRHGVDLQSVTVKHGGKNVVITTTHDDLVESSRSGSSGSVFIDTDPANPGPEFVLAGGFFVGTDYRLVSADSFSSMGEPVDGSYRMKVDYDEETVRFRISRDALGSPEEVRVAVRVAGTKANGTSTRNDWLGAPRSFTDWVAR